MASHNFSDLRKRRRKVVEFLRPHHGLAKARGSEGRGSARAGLLFLNPHEGLPRTSWRCRRDQCIAFRGEDKIALG